MKRTGMRNGRRYDGHRTHLADCGLAREVLHAAVGRDDHVLGLDVRQRALDARHHRFRRLDGHDAQIDRAHHDLLALELRQHRAIEMGLRGFHRDLLAGVSGGVNCIEIGRFENRAENRVDAALEVRLGGRRLPFGRPAIDRAWL